MARTAELEALKADIEKLSPPMKLRLAADLLELGAAIALRDLKAGSR